MTDTVIKVLEEISIHLKGIEIGIFILGALAFAFIATIFFKFWNEG